MAFVIKRISYRQVIGGLAIVLLLVIFSLCIFSDNKKVWIHMNKKISLKHPLTNHHPDQHRFKHVKQSHNEDPLSTRVNRTYRRPSVRRQATGNKTHRMSYEGDLRKIQQLSIIDRVKADHQISCSPEDTAFIESLYKSDVICLPDKETLRRLSLRELEILYHRYIDNIHHLCQRKERLGNLWDGGWDLCDETQYRPKAPCIVYSFGIGNDFSFDDAVINRYGCEVYSFDPTMKSNSYRRGPLSYFYAIGIAGNNQVLKNGRELLTYETIRRRLGHSQKKISIVKLDIELWEYAALPTMLTAGSLNQVDNLAVEFHLDWIKGPVDPQKEAETYLKGLIILKDLYDNGFRIFWTRRNMACGFRSRCTGEMRTACQEVSFIKVNR